MRAGHNPFSAFPHVEEVKAKARAILDAWWERNRGASLPLSEVFLALAGRKHYIGLVFLMPWPNQRAVMCEIGLSIDSGDSWDEALQALALRLRNMKLGEDVSGEGDPAFLLWALDQLKKMTAKEAFYVDGKPYFAGYVLRAASARLDPLYKRAAARLGFHAIGTSESWAPPHDPVTVWFKGHPYAEPYLGEP